LPTVKKAKMHPSRPKAITDNHTSTWSRSI